MKRILFFLCISACATPPLAEKHTTPNTAPTQTTAAAVVNPPPTEQTPTAPLLLSWGPFGKEVATGSSIKVHSRIRLKHAPVDAEIVIESCLPKDPCLAIEFRYEVENVGPTPVTLWHSGFWLNHRVWILQEDGTEAPLTKKGEEMKRSFTPRGARDKNVEWPVKPGAIDETEGPFSLSALSPIFSYPPHPGKYLLRVDYEEAIAFSSNTLAIWIVPAGALALLNKLNAWDKDECDVSERPAAYPGRVSSGETNGFLGSHKEQLQKLGVSVTWDNLSKLYRISAEKKP